jgi:Tfp pilus assembly protein PilO
MHDSLSVLSVELVPIHHRLVSLRRQLAALAAKDHPSKTELKTLMEDLRKIDALVGFPLHTFAKPTLLPPSLDAGGSSTSAC